MRANELFRAGKLAEAIRELNEELRKVPTDTQRRTFLFELLCFAGDMDRAEKQLDILSQGGKNSELGAMLYRSALHAERERQTYFKDKAYLNHSAVLSDDRGGTLNGKPFKSISDSDERIGGPKASRGASPCRPRSPRGGRSCPPHPRRRRCASV